jgi:hypothetical protein
MPSFFSGLARLVDLAGQLDHPSDTNSAAAAAADRAALFADWRIVGETLAALMNHQSSSATWSSSP